MEPTLHLHEFFVEGGDPKKSHVLLNITEPATPEEKDKGYFFAICEINNGENKYISRMQEIIDEIENSYYEIPDQEDKTSLEIILDKINKESFSLVNPDITLHCIVGAIRQNDMLFSLYGRPQMVLFYKTKEGAYKKMDLAEENQISDQTKGNQLFSQIVQGKIGANDYFFASTPHLVDYFNHDRLQKIVTTRPPRQSAEHLQRVLSELKNYISFGGIIIHMQKATDATIAELKARPKKGDSLKSLTNLFNTERNTTNILSPSLLPRLQNRMNDVFKKEDDIDTNQRYQKPHPSAQINSAHLHSHQTQKKSNVDLQQKMSHILDIVWRLSKFLAKALVWVAMLLFAIISGLFRNLALLFFVISNFKGRRHNILLEWSQAWRNFKENIVRLPILTKLLLCASILLALVFSGSLVYMRMNQKKQIEAKAYSDSLQTIKLKTDAAESALIYSDTNLALSQINDAKQIILTLACKTAEQKLTCQDLNQQLENILLKARKVTVAKPELLADWSVLAPGTKVEKIVTINNKIIGFSHNTSSLFIYDPLTKDSKIISSGISANGFIGATVPKENDYVAFLYEGNNVIEFNPQDNSWKKVDVTYPNQNAKINAMVVYNRRLYSLDIENNQVYKHDTIKTGFAVGKDWIKELGTSLKNGIDLAIDGDLFVLGADGKINKFTNGQKQTFDIQGIDPALTSGNDIWTYTDLNYIYILDSSNERLVVLDKSGQFKSQITAPEFSNLSGASIDETKNTAVILADNKLYQISL